MPGTILNTSGARMLRPRPDAIAAYDEVQPYKPPLRNLKVIEPRRPLIQESRFRPFDPGPHWGRWGAWLDTFTVPKALLAARDAYFAVRGEEFTLNPKLVELGVPSLVAEARTEWRKDREARKLQALQAIGAALLDAGPNLFAQACDALENAVRDRDEATYRLWAKATARLRSFGLVGHIEGDGGKPTAVKLSSGAPEWTLARPDAWHLEGRPRLTASLLNEHRDAWGVGCYTPTQVVEHLAAIGHT